VDTNTRAGQKSTPPHDIEAEEQVIGALLLDGSSIDRIADWLDPKDFFSAELANLYRACLELDEEGEPINEVTVANKANLRDKSYPRWLISNCPSALDIEHHARKIRQLSQARQLIAAGKQIRELAYQTWRDVGDVCDEAIGLLEGVRLGKPLPRLKLANLRVIQTNPRHYKLTVNGTDITLTADELRSWARFKEKVIDCCDFVPRKPKRWGALVDRLLREAVKVEAPVDTTPAAQIMLSTKRWFEQRGEGKDLQDVRSGSYVVVGDYLAFDPIPLGRWLRRDLEKSINPSELWAVMVGYGGKIIAWESDEGRVVNLWGLPKGFADTLEFGEYVV